jgi:quercetin dioxygenase-like cupin family protein
MKTTRWISLALLSIFFLINGTGAFSQDPVKAASNVYKKVMLENEKVRVLNVEFAPGDVAPWHWHPDHVVYAVTAGKLEITDKGKSPAVMDIKAGDVMYLPSVTHMAKNVGTTTLRLVVTEMKPQGAATMSAAKTPAEKK